MQLESSVGYISSEFNVVIVNYQLKVVDIWQRMKMEIDSIFCFFFWKLVSVDIKKRNKGKKQSKSSENNEMRSHFLISRLS